MSRKMMSDLDNKTGYYGYSSESGNVSGKDKKKKGNTNMGAPYRKDEIIKLANVIKVALF